MAEFRTIRMGFWQDPELEEWEAGQKYLYMYLFSCPYANNLGIIQASIKRISLETCLSTEEVEAHLNFLQEKKKILIQDQYILVLNFIRHQTSPNANVIKNLSDLTATVPTAEMAEALFDRYPYIYGYTKDDMAALEAATQGVGMGQEGVTKGPVRGLQGVTIPFANGSVTVSKGVGSNRYLVLGIGYGVKGKDSGSAEPAPDPLPTPPIKSPPPPDVVEFVTGYQTQVKANLGNLAPNVTEKLIRDGCDTVEKLIRLDGFTLEQIQSALEWALTDSFWGRNVRSLARLREVGKNDLKKFQNVFESWQSKTGGRTRSDMFTGGNVV